MSLAIAITGFEGIVLAADSRATIHSQIATPAGQPLLLPSTFDNANKLFQVSRQPFVGVVTFGLAAIGNQQPRTAHTYFPEFEATIEEYNPSLPDTRQTVQAVAQKLSDFFMQKWQAGGMPNLPPAGNDMLFLVAGYDRGEVFGRVYSITIPSKPTPTLILPSGVFGATWGGQQETADRLLNGFDTKTVELARTFLQTPLASPGPPIDPLVTDLRGKLSAKIPWQFLPLQDAVHLAIFLIKTTIALQKWTLDIRGVGGHINVATIIPTTGFSAVQMHKISGESIETLTSR